MRRVGKKKRAPIATWDHLFSILVFGDGVKQKIRYPTISDQ